MSTAEVLLNANVFVAATSVIEASNQTPNCYGAKNLALSPQMASSSAGGSDGAKNQAAQGLTVNFPFEEGATLFGQDITIYGVFQHAR